MLFTKLQPKTGGFSLLLMVAHPLLHQFSVHQLNCDLTTSNQILVASGHLAGLEDSLGLGYLLGGLKRGVALVRPVEHAEEVVVGAGHDARVVPTPTALKLVKDAVVFVQRTQL